MAAAAVASDFRKTLNIHRGFTTQIALDSVVVIDLLTDFRYFIVRQIANACCRIDAASSENFGGSRATDPVYSG
jgi:hypothetical protein